MIEKIQRDNGFRLPDGEWTLDLMLLPIGGNFKLRGHHYEVVKVTTNGITLKVDGEIKRFRRYSQRFVSLGRDMEERVEAHVHGVDAGCLPSAIITL